MGDVIQLRQYGKGGYNETRGRIYKAIMAGEQFSTGHMHGRKRDVPTTAIDELGELPKEWRVKMVTDQPDYVVWSYWTPIAWHYTSTDDGEEGKSVWVVPDVRYSATTTRHQGMVRVALSLADVEE